MIYSRSYLNILSNGFNNLNAIKFHTYCILVTSLQKNSSWNILYTELRIHFGYDVNDSMCNYANSMI